MLTDHDLGLDLVARGILSPQAVVRGEVVIQEREGRTGGIVVDQRPGPSWFVKWGGPGPRVRALAHEARVLRHLTATSEMLDRIPAVGSFDSRDTVLVLRLVRGESMRSLATGADGVTPALMADLGTALGTLHRLHHGSSGARVLGNAEVAWALGLNRPRARDLTWLSAGSIELLRALQGQPRICDLVDQVRCGWRAETLIHGDIRWDNLIAAGEGDPGSRRVCLVDWESAGHGDPAWDVGCVLAQLLSDWVASMPGSGDATPEGLARSARRDLRTIHAQGRAFRAAYLALVSGGADGEDPLDRALGYAGIRLLQFGIEIAQAHSVPPRSSVAHMQLGANLLDEGERAGSILLGLDGNR